MALTSGTASPRRSPSCRASTSRRAEQRLAVRALPRRRDVVADRVPVVERQLLALIHRDLGRREPVRRRRPRSACRPTRWRAKAASSAASDGATCRISRPPHRLSTVHGPFINRTLAEPSVGRGGVSRARSSSVSRSPWWRLVAAVCCAVRARSGAAAAPSPRRRSTARTASVRPLRPQAGGHDARTSQLWFGPYVGAARPRHEPRRPRPAAARRLPHLGRAGDAARDRPRPSRATRRRTSTTRTGSRSTRATRRTTTPAATPSGSSATATRRRRPTSSERSAADPNGPIYGEYIGAERPAADDLHAPQQDRRSRWTSRSSSTSRSCTARRRSSTSRASGRGTTSRGVLFGRTFDVPRKPHGDGTCETTQDMPQGRSSGPRPIDGTIDRHRRPRAPGRQGDDGREPRLGGQPVPRRRQAATAARLLLNSRRDLAATRRSPRTTRPRSPIRPGARRSTRATGSGITGSTRTRTTPGTRR